MENENYTWQEARNVLRSHRERHIRESDKVMELWEGVLKDNLNKLGDERYVVLEQVYICALDTNYLKEADYCMKILLERFPNSCRVKLLQELKLEALERYEEALKILDTVIKIDETNTNPRKRKVAIYRAQGKVVEAVKELNDYLKTFGTDMEAWKELCELYLSEHEFGKAAFCMEELIMHSPLNFLYHLRFAEIKYTQGGFENLEVSLAYFCHTLKLNPSNMRALYGLFLCAKHISSSPKCPTERKGIMKELQAWTTDQIQAKYDEIQIKSQEDDATFEMKSMSLKDDDD